MKATKELVDRALERQDSFFDLEFDETDFSGVNLAGISEMQSNFFRAKFDMANFQNATLIGSDFTEASLRKVNFALADLRECGFDKADLRESNLSSANLEDADLREANLSGADLRGANLSGVDLSGASLAGAKLDGYEYDPLLPTKLVSAISLPYAVSDWNYIELTAISLHSQGVDLSRCYGNRVAATFVLGRETPGDSATEEEILYWLKVWTPK